MSTAPKLTRKRLVPPGSHFATAAHPAAPTTAPTINQNQGNGIFDHTCSCVCHASGLSRCLATFHPISFVTRNQLKYQQFVKHLITCRTLTVTDIRSLAESGNPGTVPPNNPLCPGTFWRILPFIMDRTYYFIVS